MSNYEYVYTIRPECYEILEYAYIYIYLGRDNSVGMTCYGLEGLGIESRWCRDFPHPPRLILRAHPASCTVGKRFLSRG